MKTKNIKSIDPKQKSGKSSADEITLKMLIKKGKKANSSCPEIDTSANGT